MTLLTALALLDLGCGASAKPASDASAGAAGASGGAAGASGGAAGASGGAAGASGGAAGGVGGSAGGTPGTVRWVGRVDASNPAAVKFAWSGSGLVATMQGSKISVQLQTEGATTTFFQPVIDGTPGARFQVPSGAAQTVVLADALAAGDHTVELYRENEGNNGDSVFLGFVDGRVVGAPPAGRLIEIVGDSISAGYGNLGVEIHPPWDNTCSFTLDTESAYAAYGSILARSLNAEASIIARSGWGMYRDLSGNTANVLSSLYGNLLGSAPTPQYDFARPADAVVVNLGTNDSADGAPGDPGAPYEDAYVAFLHTVRSHYANAWIFLTIGPMTGEPMLTTMRTHLNNVVNTLGDAKVVAVPLNTQDATATGCDYHPNVAEDQKMADALKPVIQAKLGW